MPRNSRPIPIVDPNGGRQNTDRSGSDWPALPKPLLDGTVSTTPNTTGSLAIATHESNDNSNSSQSTNGLEIGNEASSHISKSKQSHMRSLAAIHSPPAGLLEVACRPARKGQKKLRSKTKLNLNTKIDSNVAQDPNIEIAFNIYAKPFIPKMFTIINGLPGRTVSTPSRKGIDYGIYNHVSFGAAAGFLPVPPNIGQKQRVSTSSLNPRHYEHYFQHHLHQESDAERRQTEACALYGHQVVLKPASAAINPGETTCKLLVPGLRENCPFVEEEDVVELRHLRYGTDNRLLGMAEWPSIRHDPYYDAFQPHPQPGEAPGWTNVIYLARVLGVNRATETLWLRVSELPPPANERTERFNIQFRVSIERPMPMHFALPEAQKALSHGGWMSSMLFPTNSDCDIQEKLHPGIFHQKFFDQNLNWEQKKAVESVWLRQYGTLPYLISGPPGTGKTRCLNEICLQMVDNSTTRNHILVCAPSDPATDTLCLRLKDRLAPGDMLRLNRPCRTFQEVPDSLLPYCYIQGDEFGLPPLSTLMRYRVIVTSCRDSSMLARARVTNRDLYAVQHNARDLSMAISPHERLPEVKLHWTALLLDEAAQAMEPEALIALTVVAPPVDPTFNGPTPLVVMAGDEHQLGPRTSLSASPLKESLFGRLFKRPVYAEHPLARGKKGEAPVPLTKSLLPVLRPAFTNLIRNYRSHPAILAVPSKLFYWDTLEPEATDTGRLAGWEGWQGRRWPVLFHNNPSLDDIELPGLMEGTGGWFNHGEAVIACNYARSLVESGLVNQEEVCIMSPFKAQVKALRQLVRKPEYGAMWNVNIGPTEAFQGLERGVVILCVTRARKRFVVEDQKLGWGIIGMPNTMNVALTRAKYGLIVVGNKDLLVEDENWKAFVQFCERNGLVAHAGSPSSGSDHEDAPTDASTLTRLEKVTAGRERFEKMSTGPVWDLLRQIQADGELSMTNPYDYDDDTAYDDDDDDATHGGY